MNVTIIQTGMLITKGAPSKGVSFSFGKIVFIDSNKYGIIKYQILRGVNHGSKYCRYAE